MKQDVTRRVSFHTFTQSGTKVYESGIVLCIQRDQDNLDTQYPNDILVFIDRDGVLNRIKYQGPAFHNVKLSGYNYALESFRHSYINYLTDVIDAAKFVSVPSYCERFAQ